MGDNKKSSKSKKEDRATNKTSNKTSNTEATSKDTSPSKDKAGKVDVKENSSNKEISSGKHHEKKMTSAETLRRVERTDVSKETLDKVKDKSFLAKIADATEVPPLASFAAFPREVNFEGQDEGEEIILFIRQHPAILIPKIFVVIAMIIFPILFVSLIGYSDTNFILGDFFLSVGVIILWIMIVNTYVLVNFFKWFFNVNIITTERIVDIDFTKVFFHTVSETQLERVEDVSHQPVGVWAAFFDFGTVYVQTAGQKREFEFVNVPRPRDIQDTILDLLELKQR
jgi:membrane protein YdbS with pleckstrin-like domain